MATDGPWGIETTLNLDSSFDISNMLTNSGKLSLSDIVAATIGESDMTDKADSDTKNSIHLVPDVMENSYSCESSSQLGSFYPSETIKNEGTISTSGISEFFSDNNSNACDSFNMEFLLSNRIQTDAHKNFQNNSNGGTSLSFPKIKTEKEDDCNYKAKNTNATKTERYNEVDEEFFSFLGTIHTEQTTTDSKQMPQVVPKSEDQPLQSAVDSQKSEITDTGAQDENQSTASFDSDLEDSMQFVEPDNDYTEMVNSDIKPAIYQISHESDNHDNSSAKRFKPDVESNTCPFPTTWKSKNTDQFDFISENSMPSDLNKSFSTKFVTPVNARSRSLSEACTRDDSSPLGESRFNISLSSLLGSPLADSPLSNNPFFSDLKSILESDCKNNDYPVKLFDTLSSKQNQDVYSRERNLQAKFSSLQTKYPEEVRRLSSFYRCQSAEVETERFRELHGENVPVSYRNFLNDYYDDQLHKIMNRVEKSVKVLSEAKSDVTQINKVYLKSRPLLSRKAVTMMDEWYTRNFEHPYPSQSAVDALAKAGEISVEQVKKWFANKRNRCKNTKPQTEIVNMKRKRQYSSRW